MNIQPNSTQGFATLKTPIFTDSLSVQLIHCLQGLIEAILLDEHGTVCRKVEAELAENAQEFTWEGLNDLPYGIYTLQLLHGLNEMNVRIIKRV
ncbi:MAG TPA: hypothetical protein VD993_01200 [Chitinophagaceae bacterium]|nr:hypothetical protein [Chitinophagaceae bacterium]